MGMRKKEYKGAESESGVGLKKVRREEQSELETRVFGHKKYGTCCASTTSSTQQ